MRITIAQKLWLGTLSTLAVTGLVTLTGYRTGQTGLAGMDEIATFAEQKLLGEEIGAGVSRAKLSATEYLLDNNPADREAFVSTSKSLRSGFAAAREAFPAGDQNLATIEQIEAKFSQYDETLRRVKGAIEERNRAIASLDELIKRVHDEAFKGESSSPAEARLREQTLAFEVAVMRALRRGATPADFDAAEAAAVEVERSLRTVGEQASGAQREAFDRLAGAIGETETLLARVDALQQERNQLVNGALKADGLEMVSLAGQMVDRLKLAAEATQTQISGGLRSSQAVSLALAGFATFVGLGVSLLIVRSISKGIARFVHEVEGIRDSNDLKRRVDVSSGDELSRAGSAFNTFVGSLQAIVAELSLSSNQVAAAATQIAASSEQMAQGLRAQEGQSAQVSAAVEETSASVVEVARKSAETAAAAKTSGDQAKHGGEVVEQTVAYMQEIASQVNESARSIEALGAKSEQIGRIIGVINDIADQTNLLALNAAIEAARAGEHGRGFAVVADEVRKLAERTTKATEEVARSIREVQEDTKTAVTTIQSGTERVAKGVQLATEAGSVLCTIVSGSRNVEGMVQSIASAAEEQSAATEQIARSMESISSVTRETNQAANQSAQAATQLSQQAEGLRRLVERFKI
jgi:methyl-accepting chemotaxis protein